MVRTAGVGRADLLEPAFFQFPLDGEAGVGLFYMQDERGVGQVEELGEDDAGLAEAEVFRLEAGEDQVGRFRRDGGGEQAGYAEGVAGAEVVAGDVDGAVGALGEGFADGLADALRAGGEDDDFAAVLLFQLQGFFEGVGVGLVEGELKIGFFNPLSGGVDAELGIAIGDLLDGYDDFHKDKTSTILTRRGGWKHGAAPSPLGHGRHWPSWPSNGIRRDGVAESFWGVLSDGNE